ncbi:MAG: ABC transporter substrate-binding protein [Desulfurococcales archaeon]|nr:ABC transporter substrate-binding protein [Desulfurococcales archaeon]
MDRKVLIAAIMIVLMTLPMGASVTSAQPTGPGTDRIVWTRFTLDEIVEAFRAGKVDVYLFGLGPDQAQELSQTPGIKLYTAPAGLNDFGLNPAPVQIVTVNQVFNSKEEAADFFGVDPVVIRYVEPNEDAGTTQVEFCAVQDNLPAGTTVDFVSDKFNLNPFCFRDIRFALNYLIDREAIVKEVFKGFAIPKYTFYGPDDPVYTELVDVVAKYRFTYQPQMVQNIVNDIMTRVGAVKEGGVWTYKGQPVTIIGIVRVEDQRFELGNIFARELRNLGFNVQVQELTFFEAIFKVYFTNPIDFEWSFYTEGWGKGAIDKWDPWVLAQFGATWLGWAPGWGEADYWNYKPEIVDEEGKTVDDYSMATALMEGISSREQWIDLLRKGTELGTLEAIRIWVVATLDAFPAREEVQGITVDQGAGLRSLYNCRGIYIPGEDTINVGHLWVWTTRSVWNIIGGFDDVYSVDPARCTFDPFTWSHPFNGRPIPFRVDFTVETAGPDGTLEVPDDAMWWDPVADEWKEVTKFEGRDTAVSKVVLDLSKLVGSKWHDGQTITMADIIGYWAQLLDLVYDQEKSALESSVAEPLRPQFDQYVAFRVVDDTTLEVYLNYWHFDPNYIGQQGVLGTIQLPVELALFHDYVAFVTKERALSDTRSKDEGIPQLSLILSDDAQLVKTYFQGEFQNAYDMYKSYFTLPGSDEPLMSQDEWNARLQAVVDWIDQYGIAWISNGPFKLVFFDKDAQRLELEAFRDPTYPFGPTDWVFGEPRPTTITQVYAPLVAPGKDTTIVVQVTGVPPLYVKYLLRDPLTGQLVATGEAEQAGAGFQIVLPASITSQLQPYSVYELTVIAYSEEIALPAEKIVPLQTIEAAGEIIRNATAGLQEQINQLTEQTQEQLQQIQEQFTGQLQQVQEQFQQQLEQLQQALGGQLSQALQGLSDSITTLGTNLNEALTQSINTLSDTLTTSIQQLGNNLGQTVGDLNTQVNTLAQTVDNLNNQVTQLNQQVNTLGQSVSDAKAAAEAAQSTARTTMIISVINLIILLAVAALILRR